VSNYDAEFTALSGADWDDVLLSFDDACIEQSFEYTAARAGAKRLRHHIVRRDGEIVAATQVVVIDPRLFPGGVAFVKFGPLWRSHDRAPDADDLNAAARLLHDELVVRRGLTLRLMPPASPGQAANIEQALTAAQFARTPVNDAERYFVDLAKPPAQLRNQLKSKWRYNLKRAEQRDLTVTRSTDVRDLETFCGLYKLMRSRKGFDEGPAPKKLPALFADLPPSTMPQIFLCRHGDDAVSGAVIATLGDTAVYLFGASSAEGAALGAGYHLHWQAIQWLQTTGCRWYDLGGDCDDTGLRQFKSGLIGRAGAKPELPGYFDAQGSWPSRVAGRLAFGLRNR